MELTTEQSNSPQESQYQQQADNLLSQPDNQPDYQQQDLPLQQEPQSQSYSDQPETEVAPIEVAETEVAEIDDTQEPEAILEEVTSEFEFTSIDDIDIASLPEAARTYVEPILNHVKELQNELTSEKAAYEDVRDQFTTLLETIDEATKGNIEPIVQEYQNVHNAFTQISTENVNLAHRLFEMEYPEYEQNGDDVKRAFAEALVHPSFNDRYVGDSLYDKMVDAYKLTMYRMGGTPTRAKPQPTQSQPVAPEPRRQPNPQAVKQSLVSGGNMAPNLPTLNLQEMSYEDILSRGEHLLDL